MSTTNPCQALDPALMPPAPRLLSRLLDYIAARRLQARMSRELDAMAELSEHTLDDINAPCWMYLQAKGQREAERQRVAGLRLGAGHQNW